MFEVHLGEEYVRYSSGVAPLLYFGGGRERGGGEKEVLGHDGTSSWIHWTVERRGGARGGGGMAKGKTEAMTPLPELLALVVPPFRVRNGGGGGTFH